MRSLIQHRRLMFYSPPYSGHFTQCPAQSMSQDFGFPLFPLFLPCHNHGVIGDSGLRSFEESYLKRSIPWLCLVWLASVFSSVFTQVRNLAFKKNIFKSCAIYFCELYSQRGAQTQDPKIKSRILYRQRQPGAPKVDDFLRCNSIKWNDDFLAVNS